ncbi:MAG: methylamine utilization protein [Steroidobacteraceae bacterium]|jgi:plastocyanin
MLSKALRRNRRVEVDVNRRIRLHGTLCLLLASLSCAAAHAASLRVLVENTQGVALADSVVYLTPVVPIAPGGALQAKIDQQHKTFVPRVSVVQVGTAISFPNSDNIRHSIYSFSPAKIFTLKLYSGTPSTPVVFDKTGVVVLGCNIHDQMIAWVLVINTPYTLRTDADGAATLSNLPPGDYVLRAWHEPMAEEAPGEALHLDAAAIATHTIRLDADAQPTRMAGMAP